MSIVDEIMAILGLNSEYWFIGVWIAALLLCFVFYNLLSLLMSFFRGVGGWK